MMFWVPGKNLQQAQDQRIRLGRIVAAFKAGPVFIPTTESLNASSFIAHSVPGRSATPSPVGEGAGGPCGPRTGNSSGLLPGSSSGRGGSPGSRSGGGTSGRGLPGGLSCGGSDGCPGLIGGSSCGSIGVSLIQSNGAATAMFL
jgi:hypothetical protein